MLSVKSLCVALALVSFPFSVGAKDEDKKETREAGEKTEEMDNVSSSVLHAQVLLDRGMFSPGAIDGLMGTNASHTLKAFQKAKGLETSGKLDKETSAALLTAAGDVEPIRGYIVSDADWAQEFIAEIPEEMAEQATLPALGYTTITELLAERFHCTPELLTFLNPDATWTTGSAVAVPNVYPTWIRADEEQMDEWVAANYKAAEEAGDEDGLKDKDQSDASEYSDRSSDKLKDNDSKVSKDSEGSDQSDESKESADGEKSTKPEKSEKKKKAQVSEGQRSDDGRITSSGLQLKPEADLTVVVTKEDTSLNVINEQGQVIFHAPITAGSEHDPLPLGEWKVNGTERFPKFNYNPELFWDAEESDKKAKIPAGPNSPVGVAWIDISKPHYGLHGTPDAEKIGYSESHGCVRLANWDVLRLADMVKPETEVLFLEKAEELKQLLKSPGGKNAERN